MSSEYQYTAVTGGSWLRAKRVVVENPLGGVPVAKFVEERVVNIAGGDQFQRDVGTLEVPVTPESLQTEIPLVDPTTNEPVGKAITYAEAQAMIHSIYLHFADLRDNPPEPPPTEEVPVEGGSEGTANG